MKERKINEFDLIDSISQNKDVNQLYKLKNNSAFSNCLRDILVSLYDENPDQLNKHQMNLLLCMHLENSAQSCGVLSCLQEWFPQHLDKFVNALREIKAPVSANTIEKAIKLLPDDGSWFFKSADENKQELMSKLDSQFSDYPDGNMPNLYREYAETYKNKVVTWV